jgi:phospholipase/lecithinase/hemolysin
MSLGILGRVGGPGNNYAVGGARTGYGGALGLLDFLLPTGIAKQVDFYLDRVDGAADPEALYFLEGGGNDLRDAARIVNPEVRRAAAQTAAGTMLASVARLYAAGARNFFVMNAPNVGLIPESLADGLMDEGLDVSWHFNTSLAWHGHYLRTLPELSLDYFDLFGLHNSLVAEFGLGVVQPCKDGPPGRCDQTLFFGSVHPTAAVHAVIGRAVADQILAANSTAMLSRTAFVGLAETSTPEPGSVGLVVGGGLFLFTVAVHRRQRRRLDRVRP